MVKIYDFTHTSQVLKLRPIAKLHQLLLYATVIKTGFKTN